jgi:hypothetical protein
LELDRLLELWSVVLGPAGTVLGATETPRSAVISARSEISVREAVAEIPALLSEELFPNTINW